MHKELSFIVQNGIWYLRDHESDDLIQNDLGFFKKPKISEIRKIGDYLYWCCEIDICRTLGIAKAKWRPIRDTNLLNARVASDD